MIRRDQRLRIVDTPDRLRDPGGRVPMIAVRRVADAYGLPTASVLRVRHGSDGNRHRLPPTDRPHPVDRWS
jgi:hypothetical protein